MICPECRHPLVVSFIPETVLRMGEAGDEFEKRCDHCGALVELRMIIRRRSLLAPKELERIRNRNS